MCIECCGDLTVTTVLVEGKARLKDRHTVEVSLASGGTRRLTAKHILLAQGGKPVKADYPGKVCRHTGHHTCQECKHPVLNASYSAFHQWPFSASLHFIRYRQVFCASIAACLASKDLKP